MTELEQIEALQAKIDHYESESARLEKEMAIMDACHELSNDLDWKVHHKPMIHLLRDEDVFKSAYGEWMIHDSFGPVHLKQVVSDMIERMNSRID